jgi:tetratricopeptide (TPR) repeat protein
VDELLKTSNNMGLKARALSVGLVIHFYESGNYEGGIQACEEFLESVKQAEESGEITIDELTNAEIGIIHSTLAELLVTEVGSDSERFVRSKALLRSWSPLKTSAPSRKETFAQGAQARILGKVLETQFKVYLDKYATKGTQPEGWSAGDLAHTLMEQGRAAEAEDILRKYLKPRQAEQTPEMKARDRRSDTMYLEMLLGESLMLQGKYEESERLMQQLLKHFLDFGDELWHFERFRVAFVMTVLARIHHLKGDYYLAIMYWNKMIDYCENKIDVDEQKGKWDRRSFMPLIAELSLSDCYFELGSEEIGLRRQEHSVVLLENTDGQSWILGLGTYWMELLMMKMRKRDV